MPDTAPLYAALGVIVLSGTIIDLLWTTIWAEGGSGPLTTRLMSGIWKPLRRATSRESQLLTLAGPLILVASLATWIVLLWLGWTLVFAGSETAVIETSSQSAASWVERFYFVGYSLFTLGNGGFSPKGSVWQIATVFMTASGMLVVTLLVTYVLSVLGAVTQKKLFASTVSGLGRRSEEIVATGWNGEQFDGFDLPLNTITTELNQLTVNHMAYPVLHYFYTQRRQYAPVYNVVVLDDSLTLLRFGVPADIQPSAPVLKNARSSVETYLEMVDEMFIPPDDAPTAPELDALRQAGVPTVSDEEFADSLRDIETRRRRLHGITDADARPWPQADTM
ncbi:Ion channel [Halogranum amylolyticum]|uniref:Ion channel n=1 Tax=Halogranum amylolyticum TaxID=660520 RepID=A0A1H8WWL3_9EURY|nr:ion channel [Halogranum amylolyticum]SEP31883.1 Ion channel [Halogranum amylolyticum]